MNKADSKNWIIYGSYGYTGRLIAEKAKSYHKNIILSGRNEEKLKEQSNELGLPFDSSSSICFESDKSAALNGRPSSFDCSFSFSSFLPERIIFL